jgi:hypothetical protein
VDKKNRRNTWLKIIIGELYMNKTNYLGAGLIKVKDEVAIYIAGAILKRNKSRVNGRSFPGTINTRLNDTSALNLNLKINKTMDLSQGGLIDDPGNMKRAGSMPGNRREQGSVERRLSYDTPAQGFVYYLIRDIETG